MVHTTSINQSLILEPKCTIFELSKHPDKISSHIQNNLSIRTSEKNKFGEVFTPLTYINELLDRLPSNVWRDSSLRWLEPSSGIGHFCVIIYTRLMIGLTDEFPNRVYRHRHIIKNMLYMVEINQDNIDISRDLFGTDANIICGNFLSPDISLELFQNNISIDIIIGNPPYQTPRESRVSSKGGQILWDKFIRVSLDILQKNKGKKDNFERFLCFITPPGWRKPQNPLWTLMTTGNNYLLFIHNINKKTAMTQMQVQQHMDLFVIKCVHNIASSASPKLDSCTFISDDLTVYKNIKPRDWAFLPNGEFDAIQCILDTKPDPSRVIYDRMAYGSDTKHMSSTFIPGEFIYPVVHTMTKRGLGLWYSNTNTRGHFGIPKVILNFNEKLYPYLDASGEYGMGQFSFGLPISSVKEGEALVRILKSPDFSKIIKATKWGAYQTDRRMFEYLMLHNLT
jgi:hypothetical protein